MKIFDFIEKHPEFTFMIRKLPVAGHYLETETFWVGGVVPAEFVSYLDKDGVDVNHFFAHEWFPLVRGSSTEQVTLRLESLFDGLDEELSEWYDREVESFVSDSIKNYEPSTETSNADAKHGVAFCYGIKALYADPRFNPDVARNFRVKHGIALWFNISTGKICVSMRSKPTDRYASSFAFEPGDFSDAFEPLTAVYSLDNNRWPEIKLLANEAFGFPAK